MKAFFAIHSRYPWLFRKEKKTRSQIRRALFSAAPVLEDSIPDILEKEFASSDEKPVVKLRSPKKRRNIDEKRKAFIEETLVAVNEIIQGKDVKNATKEKSKQLTVKQQDVSSGQAQCYTHGQSYCTLSSYQIIRILTARASVRNWIELDRDMSNYKIVLRPSEVAWVLRVEKNPRKAWDFFNWAARRPGYQHDCTCFSIMIDLLGKCLDFRLIDDLVDEIERLNVPCDIPTINRLIEIYATGKHFDKMDQYYLKLQQFGEYPTEHVSKCMVRACAKDGKLERALEIHKLMQERQQLMDIVTYNVLFEALRTCQDKLENGVKLFHAMLKDGICPDSSTCRAIVELLCEVNEVKQILELVLAVEQKDSLNDVCEKFIKVLGEKGYTQEAWWLFQELKANAIKPSPFVYFSIIDLLCQSSKTDEALLTVKELETIDIHVPATTYRSVVIALCNDKKFKSALYIFNKVKERSAGDSELSNMIIEGLANNSDLDLAMCLLEEAYRSACTINLNTFNVMLQSATCSVNVDCTRKILLIMQAREIHSDCNTYSHAIECFVTGGKPDLILSVFNEMQKRGCPPSFETCNSVLSVLSMTSSSDAVISLYIQLETHGFIPDITTCDSFAEQWEMHLVKDTYNSNVAN